MVTETVFSMPALGPNRGQGHNTGGHFRYFNAGVNGIMATKIATVTGLEVAEVTRCEVMVAAIAKVEH
jgi:hypothetical protein